MNYGFIDELDFLKHLYTPEQIQKMFKEAIPTFNPDYDITVTGSKE